jgi:hypothetical protein
MSDSVRGTYSTYAAASPHGDAGKIAFATHPRYPIAGRNRFSAFGVYV